MHESPNSNDRISSSNIAYTAIAPSLSYPDDDNDDGGSSSIVELPAVMANAYYKDYVPIVDEEELIPIAAQV
jgi:hypothetical protein